MADVTGTSKYTGGVIGGIYNDVANLYRDITIMESGSSVVINGGSYTGGVIGGVNVDSSYSLSLYIHGNADTGFFNTLSSSSSVEGSSSYTGGVVGGASNLSELNIMCCSNLASVSGTNYVGGLLGGMVDAVSLTFMSSSSSAAISGTDYVGGALGGVDTKSDVSISLYNSYNSGSVTGSGSGISGLVGFYRSKENSIDITQCCNTGNIKSTNGSDSHVGGMLGYVAQINSDDSGDVAVYLSYNSGSIDGHSHRGGLIGRTVSYATVSSCFNMGAVASGGSYVAGLVGSVREAGSDTKIKFEYCYNIGTTGYGILGGESGVNHKDCSYTNVYYLSTASSGDISLGSGYNATSLTASNMASGSMSLDSSFTTPSNMKTTGSLPYLKNAPYYSSYPKVTL